MEREKEDAEKLESIIEELNENEIALKFRTIFDLEAEIESRREIVEKYTKELEKIDKKQLKRREEIEANQLKFKEIENEIGISGGNKARELQEELDKARVAHALAGRNAESAQNELRDLEIERKTIVGEHKVASNELKTLTKDLDLSLIHI